MPETDRGTAWIVLANRSGARIYSADTLRGPFRVEQEFEKPEAQEHERDLVSDRPGRSFDSHGSGRHAMEVAVDPKEELARDFARELGTAIEEGRRAGSFDRLVLVAGPRFLGFLRPCLSAPTSRLVVGQIAKNIPDLDADGIRQHLEAL